MQKYIFLQKIASAKEKERKCVYVLKSNSNSSYSEMNTLTFSVFVVFADDIAVNIFSLIIFLCLFWLYRDQVSSHGNLYGLQLLNVSFLLLLLPGSEGYARWYKCFLFRAEKEIWAVESIEKALVLVVSWLSTHLFTASLEISLAVLDPCALLAPFSHLYIIRT